MRYLTMDTNMPTAVPKHAGEDSDVRRQLMRQEGELGLVVTFESIIVPTDVSFTKLSAASFRRCGVLRDAGNRERAWTICAMPVLLAAAQDQS